jgi:hypothetical protein
VLQGVETVIGEDGGVGMAENGKNAALMGGVCIFHAEKEK